MKGKDVVVPPPGAGLKTATLAGTVKANATFAAGTSAVKVVALTYVVARSTPFQRTFDCGIKFVPVTVIVKAGLSSSAELGEIEVSVGAGISN